MKHTFLIIICAVAFSIIAKSQVLKERKHIQGGSELWNNFSREMFLYADFKQALIEYKDGQQFRHPVNYNRVLKTVQFINENGDTLAIAKEEAIKHIIVDSTQFIYNPQCLQSVAINNKISIYKHEEMRIADIRRKGLYDIPNSTSAMESINQVYTWMNAYNLDVNELLLISKTTTFYVQAKDGSMLPASRKNILSLHPEHKRAISDYLDNHRINFSNQQHLARLAGHLALL